jgi:cell division protease FtsH
LTIAPQLEEFQCPTTETAPARRVLRLFGIGTGREKADPKPRSPAAMEPEERKHQFATWYFFAAFLGLMLIHYLWLQHTQIETIPYSQFEQLLVQNKIAEVFAGSDAIQGMLAESLPDGRKLFYTVRVDRDLAEQLKAHGVKVTGVPSSNFFRISYLGSCQSSSSI